MTKKKIDWPQVAAFGVVVAGLVAVLVLVDPEKAEAWIALGPAIVGVLGTAYAMSRGRALPKDGES